MYIYNLADTIYFYMKNLHIRSKHSWDRNFRDIEESKIMQSSNHLKKGKVLKWMEINERDSFWLSHFVFHLETRTK